MMHCVVTGGAGFIGSHLVERLLQLGHHVTTIDHNVIDWTTHDNLHCIKHDVGYPSLRDDWPSGRVDWVFHLAGLASIVPSVRHPNSYHNANVSGTLNVLQCARKSGARRFIYAASSSCYGIPDKYPTPETAPARPQYPYALTKYLGEQYVMHWNQVYDLPCVALRLFNVFGPRLRYKPHIGGTWSGHMGAYGAVFSVFMPQKLAGAPYTVVGDGLQTRDFVYVTDVANAFIKAAESPCTGLVLNIGSGDPRSVLDLVCLLEEPEFKNPVIHVPERPGEPKSTHADITQAKRFLQWQPEVKFETGVKIMLDHIDDWRGAKVWTPQLIEEATKEWFQYLGRG